MLDEAEIDLVNMFRVNVDGRALLPAVKKRKAKRDFHWHGAS